MKSVSFILMILISLNAFSSAVADEDIDRLALASLLIKDAKLSRAASILNEIADPNDVDTPRFYALKGILAVKMKQFSEGAAFLKKAVEMDLNIPDVQENLARCYIETNQVDSGLQLLGEYWKELSKRPASHQLKAQALFIKGDKEAAWSVLNHGIEMFKDHLGLRKQKWYYLFSNNLIEASKKVFQKISTFSSLTALDLARFAYQYRKVNELEYSLTIGEMARLKDPQNEEVVKDLARTYIKMGNITAAARLFEDLARSNFDFYFEASELWRKAGHTLHADNLSMMIPQQGNRLKQRITIALDNKDFQKLTSYGVLVARSELKDNEDIQYTLAYGHFMLGEFDQVENYLSRIQRNDLFKKALALRKTIETCQEKAGSCL